MSFTKTTFEKISEAQNEILKKSLEKNDLTDVLDLIDSTIYIQEKILEKDIDLTPLMNEIVSDVFAVITTTLQGNYRLGASGLRNILELSCSAFFYYDHKIEFKLYRDFDFKNDKYVSSLVNEHHFFKSNYIKTFFPEIIVKEKENDSCSNYLNRTYAKLCDIVHGRFLTLTKTEDLKIKYDQNQYSKFKSILEYTLGSLFLMYVLRFNDFSNSNILGVVNKTKTLKNE